MGGLAAVLAFVVGGALYRIGRIIPFVFGSLVMLAAILAMLLLVKESDTPQADEKERAGTGFVAGLGSPLAPLWKADLWR